MPRMSGGVVGCGRPWVSLVVVTVVVAGCGVDRSLAVAGWSVWGGARPLTASWTSRLRWALPESLPRSRPSQGLGCAVQRLCRRVSFVVREGFAPKRDQSCRMRPAALALSRSREVAAPASADQSTAVGCGARPITGLRSNAEGPCRGSAGARRKIKAAIGGLSRPLLAAVLCAAAIVGGSRKSASGVRCRRHRGSLGLARPSSYDARAPRWLLLQRRGWEVVFCSELAGVV